jgi:hypothetical protein
MNDFDYDSMQKKRIARGAYAKKNGSKSKKCTLPGDFLTNAEKAKLSTTVVDVNLKKKMRVEDFTKLSPEIQKEYIEWLRDEFGATSAMISHEMFNRSDAWLLIYTGKYAPHLKGLFPKARRPKPTKSERQKWLDFIGCPTLDDDKTFKPYKEDPEPEPEIQPVSATRYYQSYKPRPEELAEEPLEKKGGVPVNKTRLTRLTAVYDGPLTAEDLALVLTDIMGNRACASISIDITF